MYELAYCSTATRNLLPEDITALLNTAVAYNSKHNITGCLLYYKQEFIQLLEGQKEIVKELFSRISTDARHSDILVLAEGEKEKRTFDQWNMAYYNLNDEDVQDFSRNIFVDNFIAFSAYAQKRTFPTILFWSKVHTMLEK